ncbi:DNA replication protein DnaC, partial [Enterobacter hormaechei]|nr:DNA replication protein DnaC [Enterobacter hormaechei]
VFTGRPGTGKNHLAAAIGNHLLKQGRSVLVATVADLTLRARSCYDNGQSEASLLDDLCQVDLLVLDEVAFRPAEAGHFAGDHRLADRNRLSVYRDGSLCPP